MLIYAITFVIIFLLMIVAVPFIARIAIKNDFTDKPTERKKHKSPIPLSGGLTMFIVFVIGFVFFLLGINPFIDLELDPVLPAVLLGAALIVTVGLVDDYTKTKGKEFPVWPRLLVHFGAAVIAFAAGVRFTGFMNPFTDVYVYLPFWLQFVLTILWFVGLVTAFNFMDGLDGLCGLLALVSGVTFFIFAVYNNQPESAFLSVILVGIVAGFLRFNLPPAKIYMGDSGAYLLGYLLAAISLHGAFKQATVINMIIPMLAMAIPIFDAMHVVVSRLIAGKPAHKADNTMYTHIHYRLLKNGLKPKPAVLIIFLLSVCLSLMSIILMLVF